jgi:hypothetical protein
MYRVYVDIRYCILFLITRFWRNEPERTGTNRNEPERTGTNRAALQFLLLLPYLFFTRREEKVVKVILAQHTEISRVLSMYRAMQTQNITSTSNLSCNNMYRQILDRILFYDMPSVARQILKLNYIP